MSRGDKENIAELTSGLSVGDTSNAALLNELFALRAAITSSCDLIGRNFFFSLSLFLPERRYQVRSVMAGKAVSYGRERHSSAANSSPSESAASVINAQIRFSPVPYAHLHILGNGKGSQRNFFFKKKIFLKKITTFNLNS